jgi:hypothetical protein
MTVTRRRRAPRRHPVWFFLALWLGLTVIAVTLYVVETVL